jgi:TctA family transporter
LLRIPYKVLFPAILVFSCIGVYSLNYKPSDLYVLFAFGAAGYIMILLECEPAPILLGMVLGPMMEENLRRAMIVSFGDPLVFVQRPISLCILLLAVVLLILALLPSLKRKRAEVFVED